MVSTYLNTGQRPAAQARFIWICSLEIMPALEFFL